MAEKNNKGRILFMLKYLYKNTDEEHQATTNDLIELLSEQGYTANRKTVKDDIDTLIEAGYDIITVKSSSNSFFYGDRIFEIPELKLLIDAVSSSRIISRDKSNELIQKLAQLSSKHIASQLTARIFSADRIKPTNEKIYYIVDALTEAIDKGKQVQFQYYDYNPDKQKVLKNEGEIYVNNPYALMWNEDYYYLIGYSDKHQKVVTFRVDRIFQPMILGENAIPAEPEFNAVDFIRKVFDMYDASEEILVLECDNALMKTIIDRFSEEVVTWKSSDTTFRAKVIVCPSKTFFGWVFQFAGRINIIEPEHVRLEYRSMIQAIYDKAN